MIWAGGLIVGMDRGRGVEGSDCSHMVWWDNGRPRGGILSALHRRSKAAYMRKEGGMN
jgi:hypothetical protein